MDTEIRAHSTQPVQKVRTRWRGWTKDRRQRFLRALAETCNVSLAAEIADAPKTSAYRLRRTDPAFAALWREALLLGYERLEEMLLARALAGVNAINVAALVDDGDRPEGDEPDQGGGSDGSSGAVEDRNGRAPGGLRQKTGVQAPRALPEAVQIAMWLLTKHRASAEGRARNAAHRRAATAEETDAAIDRKLDILEKRLKRVEG